jgi:toxin ParE1/3/4
MKLEFHPEAEEAFLEAVLRYEAEVPGLGERFDAEIREAAAVLLEYPEIGAAMDPELRKLVLDRFPYSLIYSLTSENVYVLAVAHERRPPGYWAERRDG